MEDVVPLAAAMLTFVCVGVVAQVIGWVRK